MGSVTSSHYFNGKVHHNPVTITQNGTSLYGAKTIDRLLFGDVLLKLKAPETLDSQIRNLIMEWTEEEERVSATLRSWELEGRGGVIQEPVYLTMAYSRVVNLKEGFVEHSELQGLYQGLMDI